ncbi:hypothetical protein BJY01DRAFT_252807 [Aspergillus pseudoustus]|uniref:Protein kinase domain-containing protein n=1 Tax=Aspergillus pseudoustus TaxID=1810923 RepID=A0ABR4J466_9EURO
MDPISFSLAVVAAADQCIKCGKYLVGKYEDYKHAELDVADAMLKIRSLWLKTETQLELITQIWNSIKPRLQELFYDLLGRLRDQLEVAKTRVDRVVAVPDGAGDRGLTVKKFKAMAYKRRILQATQDLEAWHSLFDPSWFLIGRMLDPAVKKHFQDAPQETSPTGRLSQTREAIRADLNHSDRRGSVFIERALIAGEHHPIPFSAAYTARLTIGDSNVLIDPMASGHGASLALAKLHVRDLVRRLSASDPWEFGLLHCRGVVESTEVDDGRRPRFHLVFDIPPTLSGTCHPRTLRDLLLRKEPHALDQRFQLAKQLVRSVMFVHTSGFVHKSIRPDTIVVFPDTDIGAHFVIGPSFLIGFERFRPDGAQTMLAGDTSWEMNLYRHPKRQGLHPEEMYVMQHDIYSLGICLLEIALWDSFVLPSPGGLGGAAQPGRELESVAELLLAGKSAMGVKRALVTMASDRLPQLMGRRYAELVLACLTCLDPGETNLFGKQRDLEDEDGIVVGVQYIEKILLRMDEVLI